MIATLPVHFSTIEEMASYQGAAARLPMACAMGGPERVTFTLSASSTRHKQLAAEPAASGATDKVVASDDEQED